MRLSSKLRSAEGGRLMFYCPGCDDTHTVAVGDGPGPRWGYNGNPDAPTFFPSVLATSGHFAPGHTGECWCTWEAEGGEQGFGCYRCHSFISDGRIAFLRDCSHALAGQTVDLPDYDWERGS